MLSLNRTMHACCPARPSKGAWRPTPRTRSLPVRAASVPAEPAAGSQQEDMWHELQRLKRKVDQQSILQELQSVNSKLDQSILLQELQRMNSRLDQQSILLQELQRVSSRLDQQSSSLQELLSSKERAEHCTSKDEAEHGFNEQASGVLETQSLDLLEVWGAKSGYTEVSFVSSFVDDEQPPELPDISIRSLPFERIGPHHNERVFMGIEICVEAYEVVDLALRASGKAASGLKLPLPFTVKKGSTAMIQDGSTIKPADSTCSNFIQCGKPPVVLELESDVKGSLGYSDRVQCVWEVPQHVLKDPSGFWEGPDPSSEWRVEFNILYTVGVAAG